jgi:hypothetical protein
MAWEVVEEFVVVGFVGCVGMVHVVSRFVGKWVDFVVGIVFVGLG